MAKIFDFEKYFILADKIVYASKEDYLDLVIYLEGSDVKHLYRFPSTKVRNAVYNDIKEYCMKK